MMKGLIFVSGNLPSVVQWICHVTLSFWLEMTQGNRSLEGEERVMKVLIFVSANLPSAP